MNIIFDSDQPIPIEGIKKLGGVGVLRYVGRMEKAEMEGYLHAELGVGFVFENEPTDWQGGMNAGVAHGATAYNALKALGVPSNSGIAIYVTFDDDITVNPTVLAYLKGWHTVLGDSYDIGIYGPVALLREVSNHYLWSSYAWEGGDNPAIIRQGSTVDVDGVACDMNDVTANNWGQYELPKPKPVIPEIEKVAEAIKIQGAEIKTDVAEGDKPAVEIKQSELTTHINELKDLE